ncbi:lachrymatory-factor synthase-like [Melia azedarach]|uniref:Lachrymatory-factor synthase-like n=1 Tax=Melia azedarach TaxID=155640 RepID=A0ACC1XA03_MELAZ|nr:lachrymatory-factor synthase-like [Melia azedarach]
MAEETQHKWEGKARIEVAGLTADRVWLCLEDFCDFHKWHPNLDTCYLVEGVPGQPGLVRYCASTNPSSQSQASDEVTIRWAKEKLIMIDPIQRCFSYEVTDNNLGINTYVATIKVYPVDGDGENGSIIEWSYVADPFEGWKREDFVSYLDSCLQFMARKMEHDLIQTA